MKEEIFESHRDLLIGVMGAIINLVARDLCFTRDVVGAQQHHDLYCCCSSGIFGALHTFHLGPTTYSTDTNFRKEANSTDCFVRPYVCMHVRMLLRCDSFCSLEHLLINIMLLF